MTAHELAGRRPLVPVDEEAEWQAAAIAVANPNDCREVASRIGPDEFYLPALGAALDAAVQLGEIRGVERRVALVVAAVPQLRRQRLEAEVHGRVGPIPRWTGRVRTAARRRRAQALSAGIYNGAADAPADQLVRIAEDLAGELRKLADSPPSPVDADPRLSQLLGELRATRALGAYLPEGGS